MTDTGLLERSDQHEIDLDRAFAALADPDPTGHRQPPRRGRVHRQPARRPVRDQPAGDQPPPEGARTGRPHQPRPRRPAPTVPAPPRRARRDGPLRRAHSCRVGAAPRPPRAVPRRRPDRPRHSSTPAHRPHRPLEGIPVMTQPPHRAARPAGSPLDTWSLDREIVLTRVIAAPRDRVFAAFTSPTIGEWFGPHGYGCTTHEFEARVGGRWRFDMFGPAGESLAEPDRVPRDRAGPRIVFDHGSDIDDDPERFRVTLTFDSQQDGKTRAEPASAAPDRRAAAQRHRLRRGRAGRSDPRQARRASGRELTLRRTARPGS